MPIIRHTLISSGWYTANLPMVSPICDHYHSISQLYPNFFSYSIISQLYLNIWPLSQHISIISNYFFISCLISSSLLPKYLHRSTLCGPVPPSACGVCYGCGQTLPGAVPARWSRGRAVGDWQRKWETNQKMKNHRHIVVYHGGIQWDLGILHGLSGILGHRGDIFRRPSWPSKICALLSWFQRQPETCNGGTKMMI